jgi:flagellar export protein FliJ
VNRGFRLAAVERMRARRLTDAGQALGQARQALAEAMAERDLVHQQLLGCVPDSPSRPANIEALGQRRAQLQDRIRTADARIRQLRTRVEAARDDWLSAHGDLRAVRALRDRYQRVVRAEQDRLEQRLADELASVRHPRRVPRQAGSGDVS